MYLHSTDAPKTARRAELQHDTQKGDRDDIMAVETSFHECCRWRGAWSDQTNHVSSVTQQGGIAAIEKASEHATTIC